MTGHAVLGQVDVISTGAMETEDAEDVPLEHSEVTGTRLRQFRFEAAWLLRGSCEDVVRYLWASTDGMLPSKLQKISQSLSHWYKALCSRKKARERMRTNYIASLVDDSGNILNSERDLFNAASSYFSALFTTNGSSSAPGILENIPLVISQSMNDSLMRPLSKEEGMVGLLRWIKIVFFQWFCWIFAHSTMPKRLKLLILIWAIWTSRNKLVHENVKQYAFAVVRFSMNYVREITFVSSSLATLQNPMMAKWSRPFDPSVKINVDAAFDSSSSRASSGVVVRDSNGLVLGSCFIPSVNISSSFAAEALAVIHGLCFALDLGCMHVVLESDSLTVISKLNSGVDDCSLLRPYIADAQLVAQTFFSCQFSFTPKSGNKVVHCLARLSQESAVDSYWVEEVPPQVSTLVQADRRCSEPP
ncbi:hypothetical protein V6N12_070211 [Hibiscus sabdariffa]|uniref:RNase H type-1 domain-containing protein n=1 Tax=Hibiscus sabdariffa TaxID=183260 RepID=A0ABR2FG51_9ROSI